MLGNYDPLYKLYCEQECGREVPGKWANADPKAGFYPILSNKYIFILVSG